MRPARGCSCDGSENEGPVRKDETSWPSEGSKGVGWARSVGEDEVVSVEVVEDFRPVNLSQIDMVRCVMAAETWLVWVAAQARIEMRVDSDGYGVEGIRDVLFQKTLGVGRWSVRTP